MSTRRARIKAVATLPARRKNVDATENKLKEIPQIETTHKSPRTSRNNTPKIQSNLSPSNATISPSIKQSVTKDCIDNQIENVSNTCEVPSLAPDFIVPVETFHKTVNLTKTPRQSESNTNKSDSKKSNVFVSPLLKYSPNRRRNVSPLIISPLHVNKNVSSIITLTPRTERKINKNGLSVDSVISDEITQHIEQNEVSSSQKKTAQDDFNPPSIPESLPDDGVMDGIVPLQPARSVPKPIDLLKNEIISENAEVLFDPIVPLPSPSKVRPKLRPAPRLNPIRRNSVQGSASESEEDSRRAQLSSGAPTPSRQRHDSHTSHSTVTTLANKDANRTRNDSVCSSVSQLAAAPHAISPVKEKSNASKIRRRETFRRMNAIRRQRESVKRDTLTMYDLIFYNPASNPLVPDQDELIAKEANEKDEAKRLAQRIISKVDNDVDDDSDEVDAAPVPQIKLGPNGEIILDEQSLVIKQTESNRKLTEGVVREGAWMHSTGSYTKSKRTKEWSEVETVRFYRALATVGTDFTLMAALFPERNRKDLKLKFKKEERVNGNLVDKALKSGTAWDILNMQEQFQEERAAEVRKAKEERERLKIYQQAERIRAMEAKHSRMRISRASKAMESRVNKTVINSACSADAIIQKQLEKQQNNKNTRKSVQNTSVTTNPSTIVTEPVISETPPQITRISNASELPNISDNIEKGSLVVLTVNDQSCPSKKMLQTYISTGSKLTPVALPPSLLNSVVSYMKKGTPKRTSTGSPQFVSPSSVASHTSHDSRASAASSVTLTTTPMKRQRLNSYTITQL